jgi:ferric-dicitrate binding protein FerR (iron transport regulator)
MDEKMSDAKESVTKESTTQRRRAPMIVSIAVAVVGVLAMLLVDHGPWNVPHLKTAMVNYGTTRAAAKAIGATVTPTTATAIETIIGARRRCVVDSLVTDSLASLIFSSI